MKKKIKAILVLLFTIVILTIVLLLVNSKYEIYKNNIQAIDNNVSVIDDKKDDSIQEGDLLISDNSLDESTKDNNIEKYEKNENTTINNDPSKVNEVVVDEPKQEDGPANPSVDTPTEGGSQETPVQPATDTPIGGESSGIAQEGDNNQSIGTEYKHKKGEIVWLTDGKAYMVLEYTNEDVVKVMSLYNVEVGKYCEYSAENKINYIGSNVDTALNSDWLNSLPDKMKTAILECGKDAIEQKVIQVSDNESDLGHGGFLCYDGTHYYGIAEYVNSDDENDKRYIRTLDLYDIVDFYSLSSTNLPLTSTLIGDFLKGNCGGDNLPQTFDVSAIWLCSPLANTDNQLLTINTDRIIEPKSYSSENKCKAVFDINLGIEGVVGTPPTPQQAND